MSKMSSRYTHICIFITFFIGTSLLFRVIYRKHNMSITMPTISNSNMVPNVSVFTHGGKENFVGQREYDELADGQGARTSELKRQTKQNRRRNPRRDSPNDDTTSSDGDETSSSDDDRYTENDEDDTTSTSSGNTESDVENERKKKERILKDKLSEIEGMSENETDSEEEEKMKASGSKVKRKGRLMPERREYKKREISRLMQEKEGMKEGRTFYSDALDDIFGNERADNLKDLKEAARDKVAGLRERVNRIMVNRG